VSNAQKILLSLVTLVLLNILLVIIFGDRGLVEVSHLKGERDQLLRDNHDLKEKTCRYTARLNASKLTRPISNI